MISLCLIGKGLDERNRFTTLNLPRPQTAKATRFELKNGTVQRKLYSLQAKSRRQSGERVIGRTKVTTRMLF